MKMTKNKHLTQEDRIIIEQRLTKGESFKGIGRELGKDPTTISKEIRNHLQFKKSGAYGKVFNDCLIRKDCGIRGLCNKSRCNRVCCFCGTYSCSRLCTDYRQEVCQKVLKPPYVCNGCESRRSCTLEKRLYSAANAQKEYEGSSL